MWVCLCWHLAQLSGFVRLKGGSCYFLSKYCVRNVSAQTREVTSSY